MRQNEDVIALYSRKSKFTGKGESIGNQVELGKEYVRVHFGDAAVDKIVVYEDEGFSGGNLNRPAFKRMMDAAKKRQFKAIIVYRLDRIMLATLLTILAGIIPARGAAKSNPVKALRSE